MSTTTQPPKPKRRWYQFSLKTLLVVVTVAILAFGGWVQYRRYLAQENRDRVAAVRDAVVAIEKLDGIVASEYEEWRPQTWLEEQFDDPGGEDDPVGVLKVAVVMLWNPETSDADLEQLKGLTDLNELHVSATCVTDVGLEHLKGLKSLQKLVIWGAKITDEPVEKLQQAQQALPNCQIEQGRISNIDVETIER